MPTLAPNQPKSPIHRAIQSAHERRLPALVPFLPAGYLGLETTAAVLPALVRAGASVIEIGIPFSDPIADGPIIQAAFTEALSRNIHLNDIFQTIKSLRPQIPVPLVAMLSYSIVFRQGPERFFQQAKEAGFDALIIPDLPPPEADKICSQIQKAHLDTVLLIAPTTPPQRRRQIVNLTTGFVYYLSLTGITGERDQLPENIERNVKEIKDLTTVPVCVGFGVNKPHQVQSLSKIADGVIVGTAIVRRMKEAPQNPAAIAQAVQTYCQELIGQ